MFKMKMCFQLFFLIRGIEIIELPHFLILGSTDKGA